jgi:hypothetical protein
MSRPWGRGAWALAILIGPMLSTGCRRELVVHAATKVFPDGTLERRVDLRGRPADPDEEVGPTWLATTVGLRVARPDEWDRVETEGDHIAAWGFFPRATDVPPTFVFRTGKTEREDRSRTSLEIEERTVLRRYVYREEHGDPFSPAEAAAAIDRLLDLATDTFRREVERDLGAEIDTRRAEERLRGDLRAIVASVLAEPRVTPVHETEIEKRERWGALLSERGAPVAAVDESQEFWDVQTPRLLDWARTRLAEALSTPETPIAPESLAFWPAGEDWPDDLTAIIERSTGESADVQGLVEDQLAAIEGYFGNAGSPIVRLELRVELPGTLLRTNGTPDGDAALWLVRTEDLTRGDAVLEATSVELLPDALSDLGARKTFELRELVELADLLCDRDRSGVLADLLAQARRVGNLRPLRDVEHIPDGWDSAARELADLLERPAPQPASR